MHTSPRRVLHSAMRCMPLSRAVGPGSLSSQSPAMAVGDFCGCEFWYSQHCKTCRRFTSCWGPGSAGSPSNMLSPAIGLASFIMRFQLHSFWSVAMLAEAILTLSCFPLHPHRLRNNIMDPNFRPPSNTPGFSIRDVLAGRGFSILGFWTVQGGRGTFQKSTMQAGQQKHMSTNPRRVLHNAMCCMPLSRAVGPGSSSLQSPVMAVDDFCGFEFWYNQHCKTSPADSHHLGVWAWPVVRQTCSPQHSALQVSSRGFNCMPCGPRPFWQRRFSLWVFFP